MKFKFSVLLLAICGPLLVFMAPQSFAEELSFSKVMQVYGRALMPAEVVGFKGKYNSTNVTDEDFKKAIEGIDKAIEVSEKAVHPECSQSLLPPKIQSLSDEAIAEYSVRYLDYMRLFLAELRKYKENFEVQQRLPVQERNFETILQQQETLREIARQSHLNLVR